MGMFLIGANVDNIKSWGVEAVNFKTKAISRVDYKLNYHL